MPPQALHRVRVPTPKPPTTPIWLMRDLPAVAFRPEASKTHASGSVPEAILRRPLLDTPLFGQFFPVGGDILLSTAP
jgi:hypothetical protein